MAENIEQDGTTFYEEVRDYLRTQLTQLPELGRGHGWHRYFFKLPLLKALFQYFQGTRGYTITRTGWSNEEFGGTVFHRHHNFVIRMYWQVNDEQASEYDFQIVVDRVFELLRDDPRLGGIALMSALPEAPDIGHTMWTDVFCHFTELQLTVTEVDVSV